MYSIPTLEDNAIRDNIGNLLKKIAITCNFSIVMLKSLVKNHSTNIILSKFNC